jgi:hypothetical protein
MEFAMTKLMILSGWILIVLLLIPGAVLSQDTGSEAMPAQAQQEEDAEKAIHPGPQDIKEQTAIYVFLIWIWSIIIVLIYILRKKIMEADRLHKLAYFDSPKGKPFRKP